MLPLTAPSNSSTASPSKKKTATSAGRGEKERGRGGRGGRGKGLGGGGMMTTDDIFNTSSLELVYTSVHIKYMYMYIIGDFVLLKTLKKRRKCFTAFIKHSSMKCSNTFVNIVNVHVHVHVDVHAVYMYIFCISQ